MGFCSITVTLPTLTKRLGLLHLPGEATCVIEAQAQRNTKKNVAYGRKKNLLTDADSRTDTILERLRDLSKKERNIYIYFFC